MRIKSWPEFILGIVVFFFSAGYLVITLGKSIGAGLLDTKLPG